MARETTMSSLPHDVVCNILSHLSTKDSIRTSVLAKGWENLWLHARALDLDTNDFEDDFGFWEFIGRFLESTKGLDLKRFELSYHVDEHLHDFFVEWIDEVLKRSVSRLTIENIMEGEENLVRMPLSLYYCGTLVNLILDGVVLDAIASKSISLPLLKTMHLEDVKFDGDHLLMRTFISRCPVLEELVIVTCHNDSLGLVGVRSRSLKSLTLVSTRGDVFEDFEDDRPSDPDVEVDAPRLEHMVITDYQCKKFVVQKIGPYAKVSVDVIFDGPYDDNTVESSLIRNLLTGISTVKEMTISARTVEMIGDCNELGPLPQFPNLSSLDISFTESSWEMWPAFLTACPNLHSLLLH